jgi:hypothetical protein
MATYKINKQVLLQEDFSSAVKVGLEKAGIMKYSEKDGYKHNPDGSITYEHPDTIHKTQPQSNGGMKSMDDFWRDSAKAGELGHH